MHHQQAAQPVAACGDADVLISRVEQQVPRLYFVPLYVHAVGVLLYGSAALPDHIRAAAGVVERPVHEAGTVKAVGLLRAGGGAALGCDLRQFALAVVPAQHQRFAAPKVVHLAHQRQRISDNHTPFHGEIVRQALPDLHGFAGGFHGMAVRKDTSR